MKFSEQVKEVITNNFSDGRQFKLNALGLLVKEATGTTMKDTSLQVRLSKIAHEFMDTGFLAKKEGKFSIIPLVKEDNI